MSPSQRPRTSSPRVAPGRTITVDDLRRKALHVQEIAKADARDVAEATESRLLLGVVIGVAVIASVAYFAGTRSGRAHAKRIARAQAAKAMEKAAQAEAPIVVRM